MDMKKSNTSFFSMDLVVPRLETMKTTFMRTLNVSELSQRSESSYLYHSGHFRVFFIMTLCFLCFLFCTSLFLFGGDLVK
jgi:hypothetical protein